MYQINGGYRRMACADRILGNVKGFASWPFGKPNKQHSVEDPNVSMVLAEIRAKTGSTLEFPTGEVVYLSLPSIRPWGETIASL